MDKTKISNIKFSINTLGCKTNQSESDYIASCLIEKGYQFVNYNNRPQISIINTCTVTSESDSKARQLIRRIKQINPGIKIIVTGCFTVFNKDFLTGCNNNSIIVVGNEDKYEIPIIVSKIAGEPYCDANHFNASYSDADYTDTGSLSSIHIDASSHVHCNFMRSRPFVKIQDGCEQECSYCIVPKVRGGYSSVPSSQILKEVKEFEKMGFEEIVLTGIHEGKYGVDLFNEKINSLPLLIEEILKYSSIRRIRLSSIEINEIDSYFLKLIKNSDSRVANHLHIPLQSGSNRILKLMNRNYTREFYLDNIFFIKSLIPGIALTTDVIVGFPGETIKDFEQTIDVVKKIAFSKIHVFKYSPRINTPASVMKGQLSNKVKSERSYILRNLGDKLREDYMSSNIGRVLEVIYEKEDKKERISSGTSENYIKVYFPTPEKNKVAPVKGKLVKIRATSKFKDGLYGVLN
jgi:threonylcarbamoyladenosine tRNA methylthiotransferase MtaB